MSLSPTDLLKIYHINAEGMKLGRLASVVKRILHFHGAAFLDRHYGPAPNYLIVVSNCSKILTAPARARKKKYYFHSGCPGGLSSLSWRELQLTNPEKIVELALRRMLPSTAHSKGLLRKVRFHRHEYVKKECLRLIKVR